MGQILILKVGQIALVGRVGVSKKTFDKIGQILMLKVGQISYVASMEHMEVFIKQTGKCGKYRNFCKTFRQNGTNFDEKKVG